MMDAPCCWWKYLLTLLFCFMLQIEFGCSKEKEEKFFITSINCGLSNRETASSSSILVSGAQFSNQSDGINIIVYDIGKERVIESRSFPDPNTRQFMKFISSILPGKLIIGTSQILCTQKSATDFNRQKSILYGLRRLRINTHDLKPLVFRSAVFAYCKESCFPNITSSINLPFSKVHDFTQGPILLSFRIKRIQEEKKTTILLRTSVGNTDEAKHFSHLTLYIIVITCSLLIVLTVVGSAIFLVRRHRNERQKLDLTSTGRGETFRGRLGNTKRSCELLFLSKEKSGCYQQRYEPTTSARLFSMHSNGGEETSGVMDGFATYVKVETEEHQLIYKIPSGVSKHDPPLHPPSLNPRRTIKTVTSSSEYLAPHDYADPGARHDGHRSVYQEVDPGLFEEYASLEPNDTKDEFYEPIYDDCTADYIVP